MLRAGLLVLLGAAAAQEPVGVSTQAARPQRSLPLAITVIKDQRSWRLEAGCSLRWDFEDVKNAGPGLLRTMCAPWDLLRDRSWDLLDNTRVLFYGVRINPSRMFYEKSPAPAAVAPSTAAASGAWARPPAPRRRFHPSLLPVIDDITKNLENDLKRAALKESLRKVPDEGRGTEAKKEVLKDLLRARDDGLPLGKPGDGIEYLLKDGRKKPAAPDEGIRISTGA
ncbi:MAG: hypothetical protein PHF00_11960 [Elusimicrobia bacterium]|nr:hypothetical protein [Elusimicrobiota bacterium]